MRWQGIRILKWVENKYVEVSNQYGLDEYKGWWQTIKIEDLNDEGYPDILAGNFGENNPYAANKPLKLYSVDFDNDGDIDSIMGWYLQNKEKERNLYPVSHRDAFVSIFPHVKKFFLKYDAFAKADMKFLMSLTESKPDISTINFMKSVLLINNMGKGFSLQELPQEAQLGAITSFVVNDFNGDQKKDILCLGNTRNTNVALGWNDNFLGVQLLNINGQYKAISNEDIQLFMSSEIRDAEKISNSKILVSSYADSLKVVSWKNLKDFREVNIH